MSVNTANTPDGRGVLLFNGEMYGYEAYLIDFEYMQLFRILLFTKESNLSFEPQNGDGDKGKKQGNLYLTSHRVSLTGT